MHELGAKPEILRRGWMSPGGGVVWHMRALRNRQYWGAFRGWIADWLADWPHGRSDLLLLGPSAGWCLPSDFLAGFSQIHAVDLDPLAPWLFGRLHGARLRRAGVSLSWQRADIFGSLDSLLQAHPDHAILFGNMLGQHRLYCADVASAEGDLNWLSQRLQGRGWASFHDRLSVDWAAGRSAPSTITTQCSLSSSALAHRFGGDGIWLDHLTGHLLPEDAKCLYLPWHINPRRLHVVEAGWQAGP